MKKYIISKEGRTLWTGVYPSKEEALAAFIKELGVEALDYDAVNPDWVDDLDIDEAA